MYNYSYQHAVPVALTIAGLYSSAGAGIQADLKAFSVLWVYRAAAITAVTAQLRSVLQYLNITVIKIGMLGDASAVETIAAILKAYSQPPLVNAPVIVPKSGNVLLQCVVILLLGKRLFSLAILLTSNLPETARLTDLPEPVTVQKCIKF
ncbi:bifunctional hydroxymethylpyrimidine kinase/phosphomethylpyrimidine kinase [Neptunomonas antarctica]|uniref:Hydroxymethylpyrimidine/phosphomethylpyrimidine kinase n=1 Tax=Neptunomonas antarctica TaxID=619304 RepID=A0A1N7PP56_9GAMM|nr:bifunctional hydroxymethylpyrimidine kinase/phosphomethylpyrimidine kinase [Neptunomonas antarctica]SIT12277.1 hydroxymethylpyrimidine/phosphomethylpyrimidine kinase [Neptunomonas antarctica]